MSQSVLARVSITKNCRETHGIEGAFDRACEELKKSYMMFADLDSEFSRERTWTIDLGCVDKKKKE